MLKIAGLLLLLVLAVLFPPLIFGAGCVLVLGGLTVLILARPRDV